MTKKTRRAKARRALLTLSLVLVMMMVAVGGTIAWLMDTTTTITNTFTDSKVDIDLSESTGTEYKMVPGNTITKDPKVKVVGGSEDAWVFVKIETSDNYSTYLHPYQIAGDWTALTGHAGVYYREVTASDADQEFAVLAGNVLTVKDSVTNEQMQAIATANEPTLKVTAYAIQKANVTDAADAWSKITAPAQGN